MSGWAAWAASIVMEGERREDGRPLAAWWRPGGGLRVGARRSRSRFGPSSPSSRHAILAGLSATRTVLTPEDFWLRYDAVEVRLTAHVSERMLDLADLQPGMRVLDLATGRGEPALRASRRVGPEGYVLGVDLSESLLRMTREAADREGLAHLELRAGDAQRLEDLPEAHFHAATARWGLMYMASPIDALACARRALLPGAPLVAALWAEPDRVPYYTLPRALLRHLLTVPAQAPEAPGTFRYADLDRVRRDFGRAGFTLDHVEDIDTPVFEAETREEMIAWVRALGLTQLLDGLPEQAQQGWERALGDQLEEGRVGGMLRLSGVTRVVRARAT